MYERKRVYAFYRSSSESVALIPLHTHTHTVRSKGGQQGERGINDAIIWRECSTQYKSSGGRRADRCSGSSKCPRLKSRLGTNPRRRSGGCGQGVCRSAAPRDCRWRYVCMCVCMCKGMHICIYYVLIRPHVYVRIYV